MGQIRRRGCPLTHGEILAYRASLGLGNIRALKGGNRWGQEMITISAADFAQNGNIVGFRPNDLLTPAAFPHPVTRLELRETNISWVILTGPYAYKIKKSVQFEFIDASTLALRRHLCEEELRLNQRLASDLYV